MADLTTAIKEYEVVLPVDKVKWADRLAHLTMLFASVPSVTYTLAR